SRGKFQTTAKATTAVFAASFANLAFGHGPRDAGPLPCLRTYNGSAGPSGPSAGRQASKTKDFLTRILDATSARGYADPRISVTKGVAMAANVKTFGGAISEARKAKGWALKDLASCVLREDEEAISPQYLNDIEHDRRSPSSDRMVQQFADALGIDCDWLYYLAGRFPED